ncbi:MAG: extracellular solute-binding protein [Nevskiaceae bacterium]|jgi:putrescine transport system substrate-binding protein|nr:extracellular solute-binding protein [Nevskiaceae bacterium]
MSAQLLRLAMLGACGALLAACGGGKPAASEASGVVNVYNWSDYIDPAVLTDFTTETGIKVNYEVMDSNELLETKLFAGRTGYDVVIPSTAFLARQIKAGIYRKLDKSLLPNLANLDPSLTQRLQVFDPGNEYSVNYMWGTSGIAYNEAKISEAMPNAPVSSFAMLYDPQVVSQFAKCGVSILDAPSEVIGTVLIYLGRDANSERPEDLKAAEDVLMKIRPHVRLINSSRYIEDLANGEICLALGWSGDVLQAHNRAVEAGNGVVVKYSIPEQGAMMFFDNMAIPEDAAHVDSAHRFIDYLLRPDVAAKNSSFLSYANSVAASWSLIKPEVRNDPSIFPPPELMTKLAPDLPESPEFTRELTRTWTRFRTGK